MTEAASNQVLRRICTQRSQVTRRLRAIPCLWSERVMRTLYVVRTQQPQNTNRA